MSRRIADTTWGEFLARYQEKLAAAPVVVRGWPHQCRCGEMTVVKYRSRFYCQRCGRRMVNCPAKVHGKPCGCPLRDPSAAHKAGTK